MMRSVVIGFVCTFALVAQRPTKPAPETKAAIAVREADAFAVKAWADYAAWSIDRGHRAAALRALAEAKAIDPASKRVASLDTRAAALREDEDDPAATTKEFETKRKIAARFERLLEVEATEAEEPALETRFFRAFELDSTETKRVDRLRLGALAAAKIGRGGRAGRLLARAGELDAEGVAMGAYAAAETLVARDDCLLLRAPDHELRAFVALPKDWSAAKTWPVLVVVDGAGSNFMGACRAFRQARGDLPYVVVAPCTLSNTNALEPGPYPHYAAETLAAHAAQGSRFAFDDPGLDAVLAVVRARFKTEERFFMTGFSGGGLLTYRRLLHRPESLRGAAPACANFAAALAEGATTATDGGPAVLLLTGEKDEHRDIVLGKFRPGIEGQTDLAEAALKTAGFTRVKRTMLPGVGHSPCAAEVLAFCESVRAGK